jgi:hypothetical protein
MHGPFARDESLPEHRIIKHQPKDFLALLENFVAVSYK